MYPRVLIDWGSAILFLAPLSGFDQVLAEDETVNRLEDSVLLWKSICSNPLLGKTNLILFLNKVDIFKAKLDAGIYFGQYIISYGNRPNDYDSTSACPYISVISSAPLILRQYYTCSYRHATEVRPNSQGVLT